MSRGPSYHFRTMFLLLLLMVQAQLGLGKQVTDSAEKAKIKEKAVFDISRLQLDPDLTIYELGDSIMKLGHQIELTDQEATSISKWIREQRLNPDSMRQLYAFNHLAAQLHKKAENHGRVYNYALKNIELAGSLGPRYQMKAHRFLANNYNYWRLYNKGIAQFDLAVKYARELGDSDILLEYLWQYGRILAAHGAPDTAAIVLNESYEMAAATPKLPRPFAEYCMTYSFALNNLERYEEAIEVTKHGLARELERFDPAVDKAPSSPARRSIKSLARFYANANNADSSLAYYAKFEYWFEQLPHILMQRAQAYHKFGYEEEAIRCMDEAMAHERISQGKGAFISIALAASQLYEATGQTEKALSSYRVYVNGKDRVDAVSRERQSQIEIENSQAKLNAELQQIELEFENQRTANFYQRIILIAAGVGLLLVIALAIVIFRGKKRSDDLLLNILPYETTRELKTTGRSDARQYNQATVMFTDFKGFTALAEQLSPKELVADINAAFTAFDRIIEKHGIEKIKTIGDAYMAAGGLPTPNETHARDVVNAALEIRDFIAQGKQKK